MCSQRATLVCGSKEAVKFSCDVPTVGSSGQPSRRSHRLAIDAAWALTAAAAIARPGRGARTDCLLQTRLLLVSHKLLSHPGDIRVGFDRQRSSGQNWQPAAAHG